MLQGNRLSRRDPRRHQPGNRATLRYTLVNPAGTNDPATRDIYAGLDRFGRVQDVRWRDVSAGTDLSRVEYGYDRASNRTWRANPTDASNHYDWLYSHDGLHRLQSAQRGTLNGTRTALSACVFANCWTLDPTGNWQGFRQDDTGDGTWDLVQSRTANPVNEISSLTTQPGEQWATPAYDPSGNMTTVPRVQPPRLSWANLAVDEWANLTVNEWAGLPVVPAYAATYDAWNRLVRLSEPEASAPGATLQENQYDARNFRIVTKTYTDGTLTETRHAYYTDSWQSVEERLGTSTTPDRQFIWGLRGLDDLILRDRTTSGTLDERFYASQDANWNMTAIVDTVGAVVERYEYTPYGVTTVLSPTFTPRTTSTVAWETTYAGYRYDTPTGLYAIRNRFYHPHLGTWLTRDPIGYDGGSANLQQYASSQPLDAIDPLGLEEPGSFDWSTSAWGAVGLVGGLVEVVGGATLIGGGAAGTGVSLGSGAPVTVPVMAIGAGVAVIGVDQAGAGFNQMITGRPSRSYLGQMLDHVTNSPLSSDMLLGFGTATATATGCRIVMGRMECYDDILTRIDTDNIRYGCNNYPLGQAPVAGSEMGSTWSGRLVRDLDGNISHPYANYGVRRVDPTTGRSLPSNVVQETTQHELGHMQQMIDSPELMSYASQSNRWLSPGSGLARLHSEFGANLAGYNGNVARAATGAFRDADSGRLIMDALYLGTAAAVTYNCIK